MTIVKLKMSLAYLVAIAMVLTLTGCAQDGVEISASPLVTPSGTVSVPGLGGSEELPPTAKPRTTASSAITVGDETVFDSALSITVQSVTAVTATPGSPRESGGPAVAFRMMLRNISDRPVSAGDLLLRVFDSEGQPCLEATGAPAVLPTARLLPGQSALLIRVFLIPESLRSKITANLVWGSGTPVVLFESSVK